MKCHYEVLGVPRDADDTEIKRSYRKLALTYHPDKNPDKIDEVMELFREVQSAYDVLSDPQERAWYDKHREAIIRGGDDYVDDSLDVMYYFNSSVYTGFDDGAKSFYTVFRDAFSRLAKEDELFLDDDCEGYVVPDFGYATSDYESVVMPFYNYWLAYHTKKSFVWKEKYDIRQAPNRPTQRLMEKENKKLRETHRKKRNEEVRALVSFVRKRDKRVQEEQKKMKLKREEQEKKVREKREQDKIIRNKMLEDYTEAEWMTFDESKLDDIDSHFDDQFGSVVRNNSDESDDDEPHYYCIACDKNFKSEKALANHEKSKKHKENVELIKNELADDFFEEDLHSNNAFRNNELFDDLDTDSNFTRLSSMNLPRNIVKRNVTEKVGHASVCNQSGEVASHGDFIVNSMKDKCKLEENGQASDENISDHEFGECFQNGRGSNEEVTIIEAEKNNVTRGSISNENFHACNGEGELSTAIEKDDQNKLCNMEESKKEKSKKDKKKKEKQGENTSIYSCEVCSKIFPTRNKLFNHIKEEGHAVLKEQKKRTKKSKGKKK